MDDTDMQMAGERGAVTNTNGRPHRKNRGTKRVWNDTEAAAEWAPHVSEKGATLEEEAKALRQQLLDVAAERDAAMQRARAYQRDAEAVRNVLSAEAASLEELLATRREARLAAAAMAAGTDTVTELLALVRGHAGTAAVRQVVTAKYFPELVALLRDDA